MDTGADHPLRKRACLDLRPDTGLAAGPPPRGYARVRGGWWCYRPRRGQFGDRLRRGGGP